VAGLEALEDLMAGRPAAGFTEDVRVVVREQARDAPAAPEDNVRVTIRPPAGSAGPPAEDQVQGAGDPPSKEPAAAPERGIRSLFQQNPEAKAEREAKKEARRQARAEKEAERAGKRLVQQQERAAKDAEQMVKQLQEVMKNPEVRQMIKEMQDNPEKFAESLRNDPQLKEVAGSNPEVAAMLQNPEMLQQILPQLTMALENPEMLTQMLQSDAALEELAKNPEFAAMMNDPEVLKEALTPENMEMAMQMEQAAQKLQESVASGKPPDLAAMKEMFASPMMAQLLPAMRENPELLQQVLQSDPTLKRMAQDNPEVAAMLQDPKKLTEMMEKMAENPEELLSDELLREQGDEASSTETKAVEDSGSAEASTTAAEQMELNGEDGTEAPSKAGETPQMASPGAGARTRDVQMSFWGNSQRSLIFIGVILGMVLLKTVRLATQGKLREMIEEVPNAAYLATTAAETAELHEFCCEKCGYTMFPARGRDAKFFPDDFTCPTAGCGADKANFFDMTDMTDERTVKALAEDKDFDYEVEQIVVPIDDDDFDPLDNNLLR
jgi:hypothetical protein